MPWKFFDALTAQAATLGYDETAAIVRRGRPLSRAELGCYSSHFTVWSEFLSSDDDQLIVLEDDVVVDWRYLEVLAAHDFSHDHIEYIRLASIALPPALNLGEFLGRYLFLFLGYALGSQGYLLTRNGAKHMLDFCRIVRAPLDDTMDQSWWGSLPNLILYPPVVMALEGSSTIGHSRNSKYEFPTRLSAARLCYRIEQKLRVLRYRVAARLGFATKATGDRRWI